MKTFEILFVAILIVFFFLYSFLPVHSPLNRFYKKLRKNVDIRYADDEFDDDPDNDFDTTNPMAKFNFGTWDLKASEIIYNIAVQIQDTNSFETGELRAYLIRYQSLIATKTPQIAYYAFVISIFSFMFNLEAQSQPKTASLTSFASLISIFVLAVVTAYRYNSRRQYSLMVLIKILDAEIKRREHSEHPDTGST